jgi:hypothetical protein
MQILGIILWRDSIDPASGLFVQVLPAGEQELGVQAPVEVPKPVVLVGFRLGGYCPQ